MSLFSASLQGILARLPEYMGFGACALDRLLEHLHTHPQCLTAQQVAWMHHMLMLLVHGCQSAYVNERHLFCFRF